MEEKDYLEAFGLTQPEQEQPAAGEEAQEIAEPAGVNEKGGEKAQEPAEPAGPQEPAPEPKQEPELQSDEERRKNAAERRRRELDEAVRSAREQERREAEERIRAAFERAGLKDPIRDNAPITTLEELEEYQKNYRSAQAERELKAGKPTREAIEGIVQAMPQMQRLEELTRQAERSAQEQQKARMQQLVQEQLSEIQKMDPSVESIGQLLQEKETGAEFERLVREHNLSFLQAYKLTHADELAERRVQQERKRTEHNLRGKEHLRSTQGQGAGSQSIPRQTRELFSYLLPDTPSAEIEAFWAKHNREL